jgi:hypothetical protein
MRPLLWLLILSTSATLQAQIFKGVNYLYRATEKAKARHVYGVLTVDSANKKLTFTSDLKVKGKLLKFDITADAITGANYERESAPPAVAAGNPGGGLLTTTMRTLGQAAAGNDEHFVTLQYKTPSGDGKYAIFRFDKSGDCREARAAIEATLGMKVER